MNQKKIKYEIVLQLVKKANHGRKLSKILNIPLTTIQRHLKDLQKYLDVELQGKNKIYSLKKDFKCLKLLQNSENYKFFRLIETYPKLNPIISDIISENISDMILIFGSYAKFSAKPSSDIDIFLETNNKKIIKRIENINSKLSVRYGKFDIKSELGKEIIENHVIIWGIEKYYEKIRFLKETKGGRKVRTS